MVIYTVQPGDSAFSVAQRYGVELQTLIRDNALSRVMQLPVGLALVINTQRVEHRVRSGESIYSIAQMYNTSVENVLSSNPNITNPLSLRPGQTVVINFPDENFGRIGVNGYTVIPIREQVFRSTLPYLTYASLFSHSITPTGDITELDDETEISLARSSRTAPLMVVTNLSPDGGFDSDIMSTVLNTPDAQDNLISNILDILAEKNYFGLDIDFEYIYPVERQRYGDFLERLSNEVRAAGYHISSALAPKASGNQQGILYESHDYALNGRLMDFVTLMTYEWGYMYGPPRAVSPINEVERVLRYAVTVIPSEKIYMGMSNYGYDWALPFRPGDAAQIVTNTGAAQLAGNVGAEIKFDEISKSPYFNYVKDGREHVVWFEDARSMDARLRLVNKYGLGGVSYWNINSFFPQNWFVLSSLYDIETVI